MKISKSSLVLTAAFTGLLGGTVARANASSASGPSGLSITAIAGQAADTPVEKHGCKGLNSCKGKGGCKSSDNGCKGKNSCKGKGGCATDGK
jgi:hypothetical protein